MMTQSEFSISTNAKELLRRLRSGQRWLTEQHRVWLAGKPGAANDERFSTALAGWDELARVFRCTGYKDCIWAPGGRCPNDSPVICDGCKKSPTPEPPPVQLGLEGHLTGATQ